MIASKRRLYILDQLAEKGVISIKETAQALETSEITIRRDFEKLEKEGSLKRVQGGAASNQENMVNESAELTGRKKKFLNIHEKNCLAPTAADYIKEGDCVFIDSGTTMIPLAKLLAKKKIIIVTNNNLLLPEIPDPVAEIFVIGGKYIPMYSMNVGVEAQRELETFVFDWAFLGCAGINLDNTDIYTSEMESLIIKHIVLEKSTSSVLLLDSSKLQKKAYVRMASTDDIDYILCNDDPILQNKKLPKNFIVIKENTAQ